jgi:hypothetical protein
MGTPKTGAELTGEEHDYAEEIITELQTRLIKLRGRKDEHATFTPRQRYEPDTYQIVFGDDVIYIYTNANRLWVDHNAVRVLQITGLHIDQIDFEGLEKSMNRVRQYMVLDDLAEIDTSDLDPAPEKLYDMDAEELRGLGARLRWLARNEGGELVVSNYIIGEDQPSGMLYIDILHEPYKTRETFAMFNRDNEISVRAKFREKVKGLNYQLILEELARV